MLHVTVYADSEPFYTSYLHAGFAELAAQNKINLTYQYSWSNYTNKPPSKGLHTVWVEVNDPESGKRMNIVYDNHDARAHFNEARLAACDLYFKRCYDHNVIAETVPEHAHKVVKFGIEYPARSLNEKHMAARFISHYVQHHLKLSQPYKTVKRIRTSWWQYNNLKIGPSIPEMEQHPDVENKNQVFYQTRIYPPGATVDDTGASQWRIDVIRALKETLGDQYVGGLIPGEYTKEHYPELVTDQPTDRDTFIKLLKESKIVIYTRGLHWSTSWKMGEYLAAAKCIVSEHPVNEVPVPLIDGKHYLGFTTPEEAAVACRKLLDDPEFAQQMRYDNLEYYEKEVKPASRFEYVLNQTMEL